MKLIKIAFRLNCFLNYLCTLYFFESVRFNRPVRRKRFECEHKIQTHT